MVGKEIKDLLKEIKEILMENKSNFIFKDGYEYEISKEDENLRLSKIYKDGYIVGSINEFIINEKGMVVYVYINSDEMIPRVKIFKDSKIYDEVKDLVK